MKKITAQIIAGANIATIVLMFIIGLSDRVNPIGHPYWASAGLVFPIFLILNFAFLIFWLIFKARWVWISFAGFLICYSSIRTYMPFNIHHDIPKGAIKVLSYNVWSFGNGGTLRVKQNPIITYLGNQNADIVCLQEASAMDKATQVYLDSVMNKHYKYKDVEINAGNTLSVYSKYPILSKYRIKYQSIYNLSMVYHLKIGNDTILLINNHLETTWLSYEDRANFKNIMQGDLQNNNVKKESRQIINTLGNSSAVRSIQVDSIAKFITRHRDMSIILCGDFNDGPISYAHHTIAKNLTDCYIATGNGPGISYHYNGFYVRIDNIMCSKDIEPFGCRVDNSIKTSDHYPIYCWFKIPIKP